MSHVILKENIIAGSKTEQDLCPGGEREREEGRVRRNSTEREAGDTLHCRRPLETDQLPRKEVSAA